MEKDWTLVYTVDKSYRAELVLELLKENEIIGVIINKKDSAYNNFGEFEVYVNSNDSEKSRTLLVDSKI